MMLPPIRVSRSSCEESFAVAPRLKRTHQVLATIAHRVFHLRDVSESEDQSLYETDKICAR